MRKTITFISLLFFLVSCASPAPEPISETVSSPTLTATIPATPSVVPETATPPATPTVSDEILTKTSELLGDMYSLEGDKLMFNGQVVLEKVDATHIEAYIAEEAREMEFDVEKEVEFNQVNGADFNGNPINMVLTLKAPDGLGGSLGQYLYYSNAEKIGEWASTIDVPAGKEAQSWDEIPEITWDDFTSGRYFYSSLLGMRKLPDNALILPLRYIRLSTITNVWALTQYPEGGWDDGVFGPTKLLGENVIRADNDSVMNAGAVKMPNPMTGEWMLISTKQYTYNDRQVLLNLFWGDDFANPDSWGFTYRFLNSLKEPATNVVEPIVSVMTEAEGYWCGVGGLGEGSFAQPSVCNIQGYGGLPKVRSVLPTALQRLMSEFDQEEALTGEATEQYAVGNEIFQLQRIPLAQFSQTPPHWPDYYLPSE